MNKRSKSINMFLLGFVLLQHSLLGQKDEPIRFTRDIIDIAIVVKDIETTAKFYREVIGLTEKGRWDAPKEPLTKLGFTDNLPFQMVTFNTGASTETSTILKFIAFKGVESENPSQEFIHSSIGTGFLTIKVENMDEQLRRLKNAGVEFLGETPTSLWNEYFAVFRDPDGNIIELLAPMKE